VLSGDVSVFLVCSSQMLEKFLLVCHTESDFLLVQSDPHFETSYVRCK
jgi:hypothetical protein